MPLNKLSLIAIFLILASFTTQGQGISDFEKLVRKNTRKASKTSVRKKIEKSYTQLQETQISDLVNEFNDPSYPPNRWVLSAATGYSKAKELVKNLYGTTPTIEGENKMLQRADLVLGKYYDAGVSSMGEKDQSSKIVALSNLKFVHALDPNYKEVEKLVDDLNSQISYNVLIRYDLEGFEELEQAIFQLNTVLVNDINAFGGSNVKYVFEGKEKEGMNFQYVITLDFEFLQIPFVQSKNDVKTYTKVINKQTITANVNQEIFSRNINGTGRVTIINTIFNEEYASEPFNIKLRSKSVSSVITGDKRAIDSVSLRQHQNENSSQADHEKTSDKEFRDRMFNILRRQIQEIESLF
ncbi:hypothetical protein BFP97_11035 [Roseivirga sp. 4D4]|uniref:hypothetical protein n=1 Tax=Roseivirga sp. 4D4 TaxID=1889784 RepID=UPI000853B370|nr:hypothetical protein [Roseivirga sp. 4D4]OEK02022.1 hypothetical protein BFP97_11035 [Roseivirga sp. 4D4]